MKATKAFPSAEEREADDHAGNWHHVTEGKLSRLGLMPDRPQKAISRAVSVVHGREVGRQIHEDRSAGYEERLAAYQRESAPEKQFMGIREVNCKSGCSSTRLTRKLAMINTSR